MRTTRIDIIREAIELHGGNSPVRCGIDYYCDGPRSGSAFHHSKAHRDRDEVIYKVPNHFIGLHITDRMRVVHTLLLHPDVKDAYLSRPYTSRGVTSKYHLKIVFQGTID